MSEPDICKHLKDQFGDDLKFLADITKATREKRIEQAVSFCLTPKGLISSAKMSGEEGGVDVPPCPEGTTRVGDFHTHPIGDVAVLSAHDLHTMPRLGMLFSCVADDTGKMSCYTLSGHHEAVTTFRLATIRDEEAERKILERQPVSAIERGIERGKEEALMLPIEFKSAMFRESAKPFINAIKSTGNYCEIQL